MEDLVNKGRNVKRITVISLVLICTLVGGAGIIMAPKSDQDKLKEELARNEQALQQTEDAGRESGTKAAVSGAVASGEQGEESREKVVERKITVIGDSVFLGAAPAFQKLQKGVVIDAKISRQVSQALEVAEKLEKKGKLGDTVIISLGVNGNFTEATGQELIDYLGKDRKIYWINAHGKDVSWQDTVNKTIQKLAGKNDNLQVIDWTKRAEKHPDWFYQDGTHLNEKGQKEFAEFIWEEVSAMMY